MRRLRIFALLTALLSLCVGTLLPPGARLAEAAPQFSSAASVSAGQITATVTSQADASALVDVEIYASGGGRVGQTVFEGERFVARTPRTFTVPVPSGLPAGQYVVKVGVFSPGWGTLYDWNDSAVRFRISGSTPAATATTASQPAATATRPPATPTAAPTSTSQPAATATRPPATPTAAATATTAPRPPAAASGSFLATFDGNPGSPQPFRPQDWDTTVFALVGAQRVSPMTAAHHGTDCGPHPSYHALSGAPEEYIFVCRDHLMTALADDGHVLVTPPSLLDFSAGESVLRWDMSTFRTSSRDWINVWVAPFDGNFQLAGRFGQAPADAINITMGHTADNPSVDVTVFRGGVGTRISNPDAGPRLRDVLPDFSATRRDTFELRISRNRVRLSLPAYNFVVVDTTIDALGWDKGVVSFGQQGYTPGKDCPPDQSGEFCGPGTWHWDNLSMSPAAPFTIRRTDRRVYDAGAPVVALPVPAPEGARLRFWGPGMGVEASVDGGRTWTAAPIPRSDGAADHAQAYWLPLPAGTTRVLLRGPDRWAAADVTVWSR